MKVDGQWKAADFKSIQHELTRPQAGLAEALVKDKAGMEKPKAVHTETEVRAAVQLINETMKISNYHLQFRVHKDSGRIQVKVIDSETDKVIREIPPEKVLDSSAKIKEMLDHMAGILVDELI